MTAMKQNGQVLNQTFDAKLFIVSALELLNSQKVKEVKSTNLADNTLVGLLQLINIMLTNESPQILND
jgi:hypothetical protein